MNDYNIIFISSGNIYLKSDFNRTTCPGRKNFCTSSVFTRKSSARKNKTCSAVKDHIKIQIFFRDIFYNKKFSVITARRNLPKIYLLLPIAAGSFKIVLRNELLNHY